MRRETEHPVRRGVREHPKYTCCLAGIALGIVQLEVRVDFKGIWPTQPGRIVGEGKNRVTVTCGVEECADTAEHLDDVGIEADIDLSAAGAGRLFRSGTHGEAGGSRTGLSALADVLGEAKVRRGATLRVGKFKSWSLRPSAEPRRVFASTPPRRSSRRAPPGRSGRPGPAPSTSGCRDSRRHPRAGCRRRSGGEGRRYRRW